MLDTLAQRFRDQMPDDVTAWSLRIVDEVVEALTVRQAVLQPVHTSRSRGAFITVADAGGVAYAATADITSAGLAAATEQARRWARASAGRSLISPAMLPCTEHVGTYRTPVIRPWDSLGLADKVGLLQDACSALKIDERIVDWRASLAYRCAHTLLVTSAGGRVEQTFDYVQPALVAVANAGEQTQIRTGGGCGSARQGGLEQLAAMGFPDAAGTVAEEAVALLTAPDCPEATMDLLLMPSQMTMQIHESIGHPLELDRILGDERNYAGTSFVTVEMFGCYRYGSPLLNVTFDPTRPEQLASYAFDDDGMSAERTFIIRDGILLRPLGSALSEARAHQQDAVANARACAWNRPPIDRMANLNLECGESSLDELIGSIEFGVLMDTNRSWSIDDSRNKFQFGCELGRLIVDGRLEGLVRNPNYRGVSATFWRNLAGVGNAATFDVQGTPYCGKGEPNQMIHVGHASPARVFRDVEVFGGAG